MNEPRPTVEFSTLVELTRWKAEHEPAKRVYTFLMEGEPAERYLTHSELDRRARAIAAALQQRVGKGERVLLLYPPGLDYIAAYFGCLYAGVIAVPAYPPRLNRPDTRLQAIVDDSQAVLALATGQLVHSIQVEHRAAHTPKLEALQWLATDSFDSPEPATSPVGYDTVSPELAESWHEPDITGDSLAFLQYTSGSTSTPRGVMVSHANLLHNSSLIQYFFGLSPESRGVSWLPPYHDMGLIGGVLQPLYTGFPVILFSPLAFLQNPFRWLQVISDNRATSTGGPNFAYDLCVRQTSPEQRKTLDLSCWTLAFNGAEPIRADTLERFVEAFGPYGFRREAFYPCYGLAEATLIVARGKQGQLPIIRTVNASALADKRVVEVPAGGEGTRPLVSSGQAPPSQKIVIANPETLALCPEDRVGEIWISGPSVAQGYWRRPEETERTFRARLAGTNEGPFLRTGDLGFLKDSKLFITGRLKDLIIIRGRKYYPQDLELAAESSHPALNPGSGAAFAIEAEGEERLVIVNELKRSHRRVDVEEVARAVRTAISEQYELRTYAVVLLKPGTIPKTSSGKIQRYNCRDKFLKNELEVIGSSIMDETAVLPDTSQSPETSFIYRALAAVTDPSARHAILVLYLQEQVARLVRTAAAQIDARQPLGGLGLDSAMLHELQVQVEANLGVTGIGAIFIPGASVNELATAILQHSS